MIGSSTRITQCSSTDSALQNEFMARVFRQQGADLGAVGDSWPRPEAVLSGHVRLVCVLSNPATYGWKDNCDTILRFTFTSIRCHLHRSNVYCFQGFDGLCHRPVIGRHWPARQLAQIAGRRWRNSNAPRPATFATWSTRGRMNQQSSGVDTTPSKNP